MTENADASNDHDPASETLPQAEPSAATVARDQLLSAIGRSAVLLAEDQPGNAPAALVELARAYALVTAGSARALKKPDEKTAMIFAIIPPSVLELGHATSFDAFLT
ncbi:hypothetical protein [Nocardia sp. NPDC020380]|uniref:hypothetical protein n=1 Tax=Nocardia sp. NPDC020380 TaxID=3364309 RepID=UPI0037AAFE32